MDSLRAQIADGNSHDPVHDDEYVGRELPPLAVGQAERRLQVRAYNFWAALLGDRQFPPVSALDERQPDFAPFAALLDISAGGDDPAIDRIGAALAEESGAADPIRKLSEAPYRSLLSRIADHYRQVLASQAPVGFDAEFVNWRGATILYRGILLPFSRDDAAIDHVLCVINWKEVLEASMAGALEQEIAQSLEPLRRLRLEPANVADWADGPVTSDLGIEAGEVQAEADLFERLRTMPEMPLPVLGADGEEFALLLARRRPGGELAVLGKLPSDTRLIEHAARQLLS